MRLFSEPKTRIGDEAALLSERKTQLSEYQGFIFDYGGVLVGQQLDSDQAKMARLAGIPQDQFHRLYWETRIDYDKGSLTASAYWQDLAERGGTKLSPKTISALVELDIKSWMHFDPVMWEWITQLRSAGKRIAMLSNMPNDLGYALRAQSGRLSQFDCVTLSCEAHAVKPEPAIYELCLECLGTPANETVFFDDRIENVNAAEQLGIRGIEFLNRDDVLLKLRGE